MFNKKISLLVLPFILMGTLHASDPFLNDPFGDEIFKEMYQMQKEMDKVFERMQQRMEQRTQQINMPTKQALSPGYIASVRQNLFEDKGMYYEYNTGIHEGKDNQIDISIKDGILQFKATIDTETRTKQSRIQSQQRYVSIVQRSETLPKDADESTLKSEYKNDVLILTIQKTMSSVKPENNTTTPAVIKVPKAAEPVQKPEMPKELKKYDINGTKIKVPPTVSNA